MSGMRRWVWRVGVAAALAGLLSLVLTDQPSVLIGTVAGSSGSDTRLAGCLPGEPVEIMDSPLISQTEADHVEYHSSPPTSGPRFAFTVATGVYGAPLPEGLTVRAMEHGHVVIQYAPALPDEDLAELARLARRYGADVVLAPYPELARGVALTAWGRIELLDGVDERRIVEFVEALRGRYHHGWTRDDPC